MQKPIALRNAFGLGLEVCVANKLTPIGPAVQLQIKMVCGRPLTRFAGVSPLVGAGLAGAASERTLRVPRRLKPSPTVEGEKLPKAAGGAHTALTENPFHFYATRRALRSDR